MRQRRRTACVIVRRQREHTTQRRGTCSVSVLEHVARAINARTLAVPHAEYAIDLCAREQIRLLRAPNHRRAEIFVETRCELHLRGFEILACTPQLQVKTTQRRSAVTGNKTLRVEAQRFIAQLLHDRQADECLHTAQVNAALFARVLVIERIVAIDEGVGERSVRGVRGRQFSSAGHSIQTGLR